MEQLPLYFYLFAFGREVKAKERTNIDFASSYHSRRVRSFPSQPVNIGGGAVQGPWATVTSKIGRPYALRMMQGGPTNPIPPPSTSSMSPQYTPALRSSVTALEQQ